MKKLFMLGSIIAVGLTLLVAEPAFAAPASGTPVCRTIDNRQVDNDSHQLWESCLTIFYSRTANGGWRITRATASLTNVVVCPGLPTRFSNLWKNISQLEQTKTAFKRDPCDLSGTLPDYQVDYWNAADPARTFPTGTRFHSTWQNVTDTAHPIITLA